MSRCDPQILAARWGEPATKAPSAIVTVLNKSFSAIEDIVSIVQLPSHSRLALRNVGTVPPSSAKSLKQCGRVGITIGLSLNEINHCLLISLLSI